MAASMRWTPRFVCVFRNRSNYGVAMVVAGTSSLYSLRVTRKIHTLKPLHNFSNARCVEKINRLCPRKSLLRRISVAATFPKLAQYPHSGSLRGFSSNSPDGEGGDGDSGDASDLARDTFRASSVGAYRAGAFKFWIRNGFYLKSIMFMIDPAFKMHEFLEGARQAHAVLVRHLDNSEHLDALTGMVTGDVVQWLNNLSRDERESLVPAPRYELAVMPDTCGLMIEDDRRWFEISASYFYLKKPAEAEFTERIGSVPSGSMSQIGEILIACSGMVRLRFVREYTKDVEDQWVINLVDRIH